MNDGEALGVAHQDLALINIIHSCFHRKTLAPREFQWERMT